MKRSNGTRRVSGLRQVSPTLSVEFDARGSGADREVMTTLRSSTGHQVHAFDFELADVAKLRLKFEEECSE